MRLRFGGLIFGRAYLWGAYYRNFTVYGLGYWPSVRSRWRNIGQVVFFLARLWTEPSQPKAMSINTQKKKKNEANIPSSANDGFIMLIYSEVIFQLARFLCSFRGIYHITHDFNQLCEKLAAAVIVTGEWGAKTLGS